MIRLLFSETWNFNPLAPRGARHYSCMAETHRGNFNPLAPRGARQLFISRVFRYPFISIHWLREEPDREAVRAAVEGANFNPLAPRGARPNNEVAGAGDITFQSTGSARSQTCYIHNHPSITLISIHWLREEPDGSIFAYYARKQDISIHWLREEPDCKTNK